MSLQQPVFFRVRRFEGVYKLKFIIIISFSWGQEQVFNNRGMSRDRDGQFIFPRGYILKPKGSLFSTQGSRPPLFLSLPKEENRDALGVDDSFAHVNLL